MRFSLALAALGVALATPLAVGQSSDYTTTLIASGFNKPLLVCSPPGDTDRLFVVEQNQADIHIIDLDTNTVLPTPFLDLTGLVTTSGNEQGLLGMVFHPDYADNGYFYVNYTASGGGATRIVRYTVSAGDPNLANSASAFSILAVAQPQTNHNAGTVDFGPDGMMWIALGDGGNANDTGSGHAAGGNAQSGATLLGKMLRIDVDGGSPYAIPSDNPFKGSATVEEEIWAFGLRNPFRHAFDPVTGDLWIGDVGQNAREELDFVSAEDIAAVAAGTHAPFNFGWRCLEGFLCTGLSGCTCGDSALTAPIDAYAHGQGLSIIGGQAYHGDAIPDLAGTYFYADHYGANKVWAMREVGGAPVAGYPVEVQGLLAPGGGLNLQSIAGMGTDGAGEVYLCDLNGGEVFKIVPAGPFLGLGSALAGANGDPIHFGSGGVAMGQPGGLHLRNAAPNAISGLLLSFTVGSLNFKGGVIKPVPFFDPFVLNTNGSGEIDINWANTGGAPSGATLVSQWAISDAGAVKGVALSNAVITTWP